MEKDLAKEMARMRIMDEKKKREVEKICADSDELKELQDKIKSAYLNKERSAQISEHQYRVQDDHVSYTTYSYLLILYFPFYSKKIHKLKLKCSEEKN